jgi:holo-[acyl-carrier protein] synthase
VVSTGPLRVGTDIVEVARVARLVEVVGQPFLDSAWTSAEQAACAGRAESLAARWAAKEAALKALGAGIDEVPLPERAVGAGPELVLHGTAAERAAAIGLTRWAVSLSHDGGLALAFVVAVG